MKLEHLAATAHRALAAHRATAATVDVAIDASRPGPVINKNVYGQFAEHLGAARLWRAVGRSRFHHSQYARLAQ